MKLGRDRLFEELGKAGLLVERKPSEWPKTTHFDPNLPVFKNLIKRRPADRPQPGLGGGHHLHPDAGGLYVSGPDHRPVVAQDRGLSFGRNAGDGERLQSLGHGAEEGSSQRERPIHHSDRGCQYASHAYVKAVQQAGLTMSMTEKNHSAENALAERVNGILKQEYWLDANFEAKGQARKATVEGINLYNYRRPHTALGFRTPGMVHDKPKC